MAKADEAVCHNFIIFLPCIFNERKEILKSILKATPYLLAAPVSSLHRLILSDECNQQRTAIKYSLRETITTLTTSPVKPPITSVLCTHQKFIDDFNFDLENSTQLLHGIWVFLAFC